MGVMALSEEMKAFSSVPVGDGHGVSGNRESRMEKPREKKWRELLRKRLYVVR